MSLVSLRQAHDLGRLLLLWFVLSLGVAAASPLVHPQSIERVCSSAGAVKVIVQTPDGAKEPGASHLDCPLCVLTGAPPAKATADLPVIRPRVHAVHATAAARTAASPAAPLPARGPPTLS